MSRPEDTMSQEMIKRLVEKRANVWEQAKDHLDKVESEGRELTGEAEETWKRYNTELGQLDERIKELRSLEERNKVAEETREKYAESTPPPGPAGEGRSDDEEKLHKLVNREVRAVEFGPTRRRSAAAGERRDLTKGTATAGGNTVPVGFYDQLVEHMIEMSAIRQTNVTVLQTDSGEDIQVPKTTARSTAGIVAEGAPIPESDPAFGQVTLQAFKYAFLLQSSNELLQDTAVNLVEFLARQGGEALGNASGAHFVNGTGTGQPMGVVTASTLGVTGATGQTPVGAFRGDDLIDLMFSVIAPYRRRGSWLLDDMGIATARKLKGSDGHYLWQPGLVAGEPDTLLGKPVAVDPNVPAPAASARSALFGDFSKYFIRDVASVRIERSDDFAFANDLVTWRFIVRTDGDLVDTTGAIKHFVGAAT